jgi:hypothetical protein
MSVSSDWLNTERQSNFHFLQKFLKIKMQTRCVFDNIPNAYKGKLRYGFYPLRNLITNTDRQKERQRAPARKTIHPQHMLGFVINYVYTCSYLAHFRISHQHSILTQKDRSHLPLVHTLWLSQCNAGNESKNIYLPK